MRRRLSTLIVLATALVLGMSESQAADRSGRVGRNAGYWGYGNHIGRHHRHGPWATPGGYPKGSDPYVRGIGTAYRR